MLLEKTPVTEASQIADRAVGEYVLHKVVADSTESALARGDIELAKIRQARGDKHLRDAHAWQLENQGILEAQARGEMEAAPH